MKVVVNRPTMLFANWTYRILCQGAGNSTLIFTHNTFTCSHL